MRSPHYFAVACRAPNGNIVVHTEELAKTWVGRQKWLKLPFLRGTLAILDGMALGIKSMRFAGDVQMRPELASPEPEALASTPSANASTPTPAAKAVPAEGLPQPAPTSTAIQSASIIGALVVGLGMGIMLFQYVPNLVAQFSSRWTGDKQGTATNFIAECAKVVIFLAYLWLIGRMAAIKDVFRYHGAEHKAINVIEAGEELNLENATKITRLHPRCGTSFAVIVLIVSFLFLPLVPRYPVTGAPGNLLADTTVRVLIELCIVPLIAGVSYELLRLAGRFRSKRIITIAFAPGLWSQQFLTTLEPEQKHLEVAIASLKAVLQAEATGEELKTDNYEAAPIELKPVTSVA